MNKPEEILEWIKSRRSTRHFKEQPVEKEKLEMTLEAGRYAPSGGNSQQNRFYVIQDPKILNDLRNLVKQEFSNMEITEGMYSSMINSIKRSKSGNYDFIYNSPVLIIVTGPKSYPNHLADASVAMENMMLMANAMDLGSVWINQLHWLEDNEAIRDYLEKLGISKDQSIGASLAVGVADTESGLPNREPLKRHGNEVIWVEEISK